MMLLVSLAETEGDGDGVRLSSVGLMLEGAGSDTGVSDTGDSLRTDGGCIYFF